MKTNTTDPSRLARQLGYGGLIPFVVLAAALWFTPPVYGLWLSMSLLAYAATIASFLGAIHWGLAMRDASSRKASSLVWGVAPSLIAWLALLLGQAGGLLLVAALLGTCYVVDRAVYPRYGLQAWLPMRLHLTLVASASCIAGAAALPH